jgi:uncharacterized protein YkwD
MRCLVNFARRGRGLPAYAASGVLDRAAAHKSADILRCGEFSHEACGHSFTYWMEHLGHPQCSAGENIAWGSGRLGAVRSIFRSWMHSQGHRENIPGPFDEIGIGLRSGSLEGYGRRPRLDPGLRQPRLLRGRSAPRMAPCPTPSTSPTAIAISRLS